MRPVLLLSLLSLSVGCDKGALVVVTVSSDTAIHPSSLAGTITLGGTTKPFSLPVGDAGIPPDFVFGIELPTSASGSVDVTVTTVGLSPELTRSGSVPVVAHGRADLALHLGPGGPDMGVPPDLFDRDALPIFSHKYVVSHVQLSRGNSDYVYDVDGDGNPENRYGVLVMSDTNMVTPSAFIDEIAVNQSITSGKQLALLELRTTDGTFMSDGAATSVLRAAFPKVPALDGTDQLTVLTAVTPVQFDGSLSGGTFTSVPSATSKDPHTLHLLLATAGLLVPVTLVATHVSYHVTSSGVMMGQLNGAIANATIQTETIPAMATAMTQAIASGMGINFKIFDTGDTVNPCDAGMPNDLSAGGMCGCAVAGDNIIAPCELSQSGFIQALLAPDLDLYDNNGQFKPDPALVSKDSLSVGLGFVAVPATY